MEKFKLTTHQLFAMTANYTCGTSIIIVSASLAGIAKQDAWISAMTTPIFGLFFIWLYYSIGKEYQNKTYIDIIYSVFGKWIGSIISIGFVFICLLDVPQITWYVGSFMTSQYLITTPKYIIYVVIIIALAIALLYGIETIARSSEIFIYIVTLMLIFTFIMASPNAKIENLMPILENGMLPVLKGSLLLVSYTTWPIIIFNMVQQINISDGKSTFKPLIYGYLLGSIIIFLCTLMSILVLGSIISSRYQYPVYLLAKEINIGTFFTRLEAIITGAWIITLFFKILMYFYAGIIGLSQLLGIKEYRKIVLPLSLILLVYSDVVYTDSIYEAEWDSSTWILFIATFAVILPIVILIITKIKKIIKMR